MNYKTKQNEKAINVIYIPDVHILRTKKVHRIHHEGNQRRHGGEKNQDVQEPIEVPEKEQEDGTTATPGFDSQSELRHHIRWQRKTKKMSKTTDEIEHIISIIKNGDEYIFRIENINEDGYKVIKEKEFASVEEVLIELGKIL